ncbi:cell division protein FtsQ/DivIB [Companilactobacillus sp.]|jgi:cell division protein FtsQ|uniref:cell division protein FtsQ/DivIB n=1 Tax=Companilactobacillus sp. TaxID=2767905 RepID=UPI0025BB26E0|nr:cell division protein FtsQ/DivIB [Companilactobacillus sp.]MCH4008445.1 cell division protein FtsQ/DivIB [Companilactobacillus sp.]MCH4051376.1 cell division protein FtsQ/DivIB [Companilactobacillus sp.]MCH4076388.1 cell division protein FtsQ/DivIB [Companilactobacillus sp.]MCH4124963.1 cell division protein FtsQ/DivIB [Companilactobacillus sp.]MCH4131505.1 cell division protein FtsQ/DivIB [Companilactobacillus sp.]
MSKKRRSYAKSILIIIAAILIIILAYLGSPLSKVRNITVKGVSDLGAQQVIDATQINDNSLLVGVFVRQNSISEKTHKQLPSVKSVSFKTKNLRDLTIVVHEYPTLGLIFKDGYYYRIIDNGKILSNKLKSYTGNYPIYTDFDKKSDLIKITQIYKKMPESVKNNISEIHNAKTKINPYRIKIDMNDGNKIIADTRTVDKKMKYYPSIASQMKKKGVIDLEVGAYSYPFDSKK